MGTFAYTNLFCASNYWPIDLKSFQREREEWRKNNDNPQINGHQGLGKATLDDRL